MLNHSLDEMDLKTTNAHVNLEENESSPSKKLERRRRIEELFEEKRLRDELEDFSF